MISQTIKAFFIFLVLTSCGSEKAPPEDKNKVERHAQRTFIGKWRVFNDAGTFFYIAINPDGSASSTWSGGERGKWEVKNDRVILTWNNGWRDILFEEEGSFKKIAFSPNTPDDAPPSSHANAEKVDSIPAGQ